MNNQDDLARRMAGIEPFYVMELLAQARQLEAEGQSIIHMEVGEPDFPTPEPVSQAAQSILDTNPLHYTQALGLPELREAISGLYRQRYGLEVPAARIAITPGSSGALQLVMGILVNPGDRVVMADPGYPCNRHFVRLFGGIAGQIPVSHNTLYQPDRDTLERYWDDRTRAVMLASPSNPTGSIIPQNQLQQIYTYARKQDAALIVDEIYHGLTYGVEPQTALALGDSVFVINSFSKFFGMTGWRLGWVVAPRWAMDALDRLAQNLFLSPPTLSQYAALSCFQAETMTILEARRQDFQARRDYLLPALKSLGFKVKTEPQGAFYIYADSTRFSADSYSFCYDLLLNAGVAVTPGRDFGTFNAAGHVRFAYTAEMEQLAEGVKRLGDYLGGKQ